MIVWWYYGAGNAYFTTYYPTTSGWWIGFGVIIGLFVMGTGSVGIVLGVVDRNLGQIWLYKLANGLFWPLMPIVIVAFVLNYFMAVYDAVYWALTRNSVGWVAALAWFAYGYSNIATVLGVY